MYEGQAIHYNDTPNGKQEATRTTKKKTKTSKQERKQKEIII